MQFIDLQTQYQKYKKEIDAAMQQVLDNSTYVMGPQVKDLETQLAAYVGVKHCVGASSGTDTLMIAMMALGIGPGDEVITTPFTWISTVEMIVLLGAKPVYVDIELDTYNLDVDKIEAKITPRTKAIMPVGLFGQLPDFKKINAIAKKHNIPVIEDAAQSFGATQNGIQSCAHTLIGSTSFFPAKPFGCYGDGGALFTSDDALAAKFRALRVHGGEVRNHHTLVGINGRLDTLQAAIMIAKLPHFNNELRLRDKIAARYSDLLGDCCVTPKVVKGNTSSWAMYTIRHPERDRIAEHLKQKGAPTGIYYPVPCYKQPAYLSKEQCPITEQACKEVLSLPMHPWLTEKDQDTVISAIKECVSAHI